MKVSILFQSESPLLSDAVEALNVSASSLHKTALALLGSSMYVTLTALDIQDPILFFSDKVTLPLVQLKVPLRAYAWLAPSFLFAFQAYILFHHWFLAWKLRQITERLSAANEDALTSSLKLEQHPNLLPSIAILRMLRIPREKIPKAATTAFHGILYVGAPLLPHLVLIVRCVPLREEMLTNIQKLILIAATLLSLFILAQILDPELSAVKSITRIVGVIKYPTVPGVTTLALALVAFTLVGYTMIFINPQSDCNPEKYPKVFAILGMSPNLDLSDLTLSASRSSTDAGKETKEGETLAKSVFSTGARDFTCADFSGSRLTNINFQGATLQSAKFNRAVLTRVDFLPKGVKHWQQLAAPEDLARNRKGSREEGVQLEGADFSEATLRSVRMPYARISNAGFAGAQFHNSTLFFAFGEGIDFRGTKFHSSQLQNAEFPLAALQGARIENSDLTNIDLTGSHLRDVTLVCTNIQGAKLTGVFMPQSRMAGVSMAGADFSGANLSSARLYGVANFSPSVAILKGAQLSGKSNSIVVDSSEEIVVDSSGEIVVDSSEESGGRLLLDIRRSRVVPLEELGTFLTLDPDGLRFLGDIGLLPADKIELPSCFGAVASTYMRRVEGENLEDLFSFGSGKNPYPKDLADDLLFERSDTAIQDPPYPGLPYEPVSLGDFYGKYYQQVASLVGPLDSEKASPLLEALAIQYYCDGLPLFDEALRPYIEAEIGPSALKRVRDGLNCPLYEKDS